MAKSNRLSLFNISWLQFIKNTDDSDIFRMLAKTEGLFDASLSAWSNKHLEKSHCREKIRNNLMSVDVAVITDDIQIKQWDVSVTLVGRLGIIGTSLFLD